MVNLIYVTLAFFKKVNCKAYQTTATPSKLALPKQYPKCNQKQFRH